MKRSNSRSCRSGALERKTSPRSWMIYLDYNATTPLCVAARDAMEPFLARHYGNPSSVHAAGREARAALDDARDRLADLLGAKPLELIFTGSGTESNNLAVLGLARSHASRR